MNSDDNSLEKIMDYALCTFGAIVWLIGVFTNNISEMLVGIGLMVLTRPH